MPAVMGVYPLRIRGVLQMQSSERFV